MMNFFMPDILVMYFVYVRLCPIQNTALRLFLSPEEDDDQENKAKQHFHQTGTYNIHFTPRYTFCGLFTCAVLLDIAHISL